jgi:gas vesicle protein
MEDTDFDLLCEGASPEEAKRIRKLLAEWFSGDESGFPLQFVLITRAQWRAAARVPEHIRTECQGLETAFGEQHRRMGGLLRTFESGADLRLKALKEAAERQDQTIGKLFAELERENAVAKAYAATVRAELDRATVLWNQAKDDLQEERRKLAEEWGRLQRESRLREAINFWTMVLFLFGVGGLVGWLARHLMAHP